MEPQSVAHTCRAFKGSLLYGRVHTWCLGTVPKYDTRWALMWTHPFLSTHARIRSPKYKNETLFYGTKVGTRVPVRRPFLIVLGKCRALYSLLSSCFKMTSDRAKWSNYVYSYISSTQGMNITRSCRYPGTGYPESSVDSPEELSDNASICFIFVLLYQPYNMKSSKGFLFQFSQLLTTASTNSKASTQQQQQKTTSYSSSLT